MKLEIAIVTPFDPKTRAGYSHLLVSEEIKRVFDTKAIESTIYHFESRKIPEKNILFVGGLTASTLGYLSRFIPEKKVVFYAACEGFPIMPPNSVEREVAKKIDIVAISQYTKMCMETAQLECSGVVYHGIDMRNDKYDENYAKWIKNTWIKKANLILYVAGNMMRKGLDKYISAFSQLQLQSKKIKAILHSGGGELDQTTFSNRLGLTSENFWNTNAFGVLNQEKINALFALCDVYVHPAHCEGFGRPMIEAMRFLKPVVAVDAPPFNEIVDNGSTGILIECTGVESYNWMNAIQFNLHQYRVSDLANAIYKLLNKKVQNRMSREIQSKRLRFDSNRTYSELTKYFK